MSLQYIRDTYGVPAKKGERVAFDEKDCPPLTGREGVITGASGPHVMVRFDGVKHAVPCHPKALRYLSTEVDEA